MLAPSDAIAFPRDLRSANGRANLWPPAPGRSDPPRTPPIGENREMDTLSAAAAVEEYVEQWRHSDLHDKMHAPMAINNGPVVELTAIAVYDRHQGNGYATRALQMLTAICDEHGLTIELVARPLDPGLGFTPGCSANRSTSQLMTWYGRHGFVDESATCDDTHRMVRRPHLFG